MSSQIEQIKSRIDLVAFIQEYIKLQKAGANFKARCPFHNEKTPSFNVSPAREIWHCFGCGRGGDAFAFLMEIEHIEFPEALRILAERTGVRLKREDPALQSKRARLLDLLNEAGTFYEQQLKEAQPVIAYMKSRGVTGVTAKQFHIGFAPAGWRNTLAYLKGKGYAAAEIEEVGLVIKKEGADSNASREARYYDRFRSRIMFPLTDTSGRIIGFSGRMFEDASSHNSAAEEELQAGAKYINTPQTLFFDKSRFLYNFDKARRDIARENTVIIVEGQMDVLLSYQGGIKNVVAVSGTALTREHLGLLKRVTDNAAFSFDMDAAGITAARRATELAAGEGMNVSIIELPEGTDPADIAKKNLKEWKNAIQGAKESVAFFLSRAIEKYSLTTAQAKKKIGADVLPLVVRLASEMERAHWVSEIARRLSLPEEACREELKRYIGKETAASPRKGFTQEQAREREQMNRKARLERRMLGCLLLRPDLLPSAAPLPAKDECALQDAEMLFEWLTAQTGACTNTKDLLQQMDAGVKTFADELLFEAEQLKLTPEEIEKELALCVRAWEGERIRERILKLQMELRAAEDKQDKPERERILKLIHELSGRKR